MFADPVPEALSSVTQFAGLLAVQLHADAVDTVMDPEEPAATDVTLVGDTVKEQDNPACVIAMVWPAMATVAVRAEDPALAATVYGMFAGPVPDEAPSVIQLAVEIASQPHPLAVVTAKFPEAPADGGVRLVGDTLKLQPPPAA
jgi:hypothetical protein